MRIIRAGDCKTTPWKNGGGSTTEIAASPEGASFETFDWRVSMAQVASDGAFSDFPGIDRTLVVIKGSGLMLTVGRDDPVELGSGGEPLRFQGETPASARLTDGAIIDLNVMTRRDRFAHHLSRVLTPGPYGLAAVTKFAVVLSFDGETTVRSGHGSEVLGHGDAAIIDRTTSDGFDISAITGQCFLIRLRLASLGMKGGSLTLKRVEPS